MKKIAKEKENEIIENERKLEKYKEDFDKKIKDYNDKEEELKKKIETQET